MVAVIFPITWIISKVCTNSVWFFKRGGNDLPKYILNNSMNIYI